MTIEEVREFAGAVGVLMANRYLIKEDLIRVIQLSMGGEDCYRQGTQCHKRKCEWYEECVGQKITDG